ncbi:UPF0711 protein C18orf21 homolog, partial [Octodon degus]|uniref:UPF0711 protein C18orf21 homolog n=1 Tax=Octodon degus TaxID=10160 RepID=A0A6P6EA72_OCTDE
HYLEAAARSLRDSCPGQARYLLWAYSAAHDDKSTFEEACPYCFQLLVLDNSRVRLKPKAKLTPRVQKLLNREARNHTLSFKEAKIVKKYRESKNVLLITCKTCNRTVKYPGKSRSFLSALGTENLYVKDVFTHEDFFILQLLEPLSILDAFLVHASTLLDFAFGILTATKETKSVSASMLKMLLDL